MNVEISSDNIFWTDIVVHSATGDLVFDGWLEMDGGEWVLDRKAGGHGEQVKKWRGRRDFLLVLADALRWINTDIAKAEGK